MKNKTTMRRIRTQTQTAISYLSLSLVAHRSKLFALSMTLEQKAQKERW